MRIVLLVCGLIGIVVGVNRMYTGVTEIMGAGEDPQVMKLLAESDQTIEEANKLTQAAAPLFQGLLNDVDNLGLDVVRKDKREATQKVSGQFADAATKARAAASKLDEAATHKVNDKLKPFLATKSRAYGFYAQACEQNQEIIRLVLDESIAKIDDLLPKIEAVAARREEAEKAAATATAEADEIVKQSNATPAKK